MPSRALFITKCASSLKTLEKIKSPREKTIAQLKTSEIEARKENKTDLIEQQVEKPAEAKELPTEPSAVMFANMATKKPKRRIKRSKKESALIRKQKEKTPERMPGQPQQNKPTKSFRQTQIFTFVFVPIS